MTVAGLAEERSEGSPTPEQKKCEEETGHDFEWSAPEWDVGFHGYGQCRTCGWMVPYEEADFDDNYC